MSLATMLWQTSQNGTTWTDMKSPSSYKISYEDLDNDTYRSVINGNLIRTRIKPRWAKIFFTYNFLTSAEVDALARAVNTNDEFYVKCKTPAFGNSQMAPVGTSGEWFVFRCYCSKYSAELLPAQVGWTMEFNIIQSKGGTWQ